MKLTNWLRKQNLSQAQFAKKRLGVTPGQLSQWIRGHKNMLLARAVQIEKETNGEVPPRVWVRK